MERRADRRGDWTTGRQPNPTLARRQMVTAQASRERLDRTHGAVGHVHGDRGCIGEGREQEWTWTAGKGSLPRLIGMQCRLQTAKGCKADRTTGLRLRLQLRLRVTAVHAARLGQAKYVVQHSPRYVAHTFKVACQLSCWILPSFFFWFFAASRLSIADYLADGRWRTAT